MSVTIQAEQRCLAREIRTNFDPTDFQDIQINLNIQL